MKTKAIILILVLVILGIIGWNKFGSKRISDNTKTLVGSDLDGNGCKTSAGYTFSKVKNSCIRVFESGIRLDPKEKGMDQSLSAFAVFKSDDEDKQVEIFLPNSSTSMILNKVPDSGAGTWENDNYKLLQWKGTYYLDNFEKTIYEGTSAPNI